MDFLLPRYQHTACDIFYNQKLKAVQTLWKGFLSEGDDFRLILNHIIDVLEEFNAELIIADARQLKIITFEDQKWIIDDWYPRAVKAGFRTEALIVTPESYSEQSIKKIVKSYDTSLVTTWYFTSYDQVEEWHNHARVN
jgi:hypothetical protein